MEMEKTDYMSKKLNSHETLYAHLREVEKIFFMRLRQSECPYYGHSDFFDEVS